MENQHENFIEKLTNLIKKLYAKLHNAKISKKIASLILTTATVLTISSCDPSTFPNNDNDTTNNGQNNEQNNQQNQIDWSKYSQLLEDLCNDPYYDNLILRAKANDKSVFESGELAPHPYAFLEDEGFDVAKIKNGSIEAHTLSYVLDESPNNLFINTRVLQDNSYWVSYILNYELTDEEMKDYRLLHGSTYYIQSVFMNN